MSQTPQQGRLPSTWKPQPLFLSFLFISHWPPTTWSMTSLYVYGLSLFLSLPISPILSHVEVEGLGSGSITQNLNFVSHGGLSGSASPCFPPFPFLPLSCRVNSPQLVTLFFPLRSLFLFFLLLSIFFHFLGLRSKCCNGWVSGPATQ